MIQVMSSFEGGFFPLSQPKSCDGVKGLANGEQKIEKCECESADMLLTARDIC